MELKVYYGLDNSPIDTLTQLERSIFPDSYRLDSLKTMPKQTDDLISIVAYEGSTPCGFKMGYKYKNNVFYSWLGGTLKEYQGKGVAKQLMTKQHEALKDRGYQFVRTTARTHNNPMIILNLKSGFQIVGLKTNLKSNQVSVQLEKKL